MRLTRYVIVEDEDDLCVLLIMENDEGMCVLIIVEDEDAPKGWYRPDALVLVAITLYPWKIEDEKSLKNIV